jgi:predicted aspartyl protease
MTERLICSMNKNKQRLGKVSMCITSMVVFCGDVRAEMGPAQPNAECQLKMEARLPITENSGHYMVPAGINGKDYLMIVNTGADKTALATAMADALKLGSDDSSAVPVVGAGFDRRSEYFRVVPSFKLGPSEWIDLKVLSDQTLPPKLQAMQPAPAGMLGTDVLSRYDVEFDFPARTMTLYTAQNCLGRYAPWQGNYYNYYSEYTKKHRVILPLELNGHPVRAVLDTGAVLSLVARSAAVNAGVEQSALDQVQKTSGSGAAGAAFVTRRYRFDSLRIGPLVYHHVPLVVGDTTLASADMLLGMDFMRSRRVWVSYSTGAVFMQPAQSGKPSLAGQDAPTLAPEVASVSTDETGDDSLRKLISRRPDLSTHSHMTYTPNVRIEQRARLQPPP